MELEKQGIPTVTICTEAFVELARTEAKNLGLPDLPLAIVQHPMGGLSTEQVLQRSHEAWDQVIAALTREVA